MTFLEQIIEIYNWVIFWKIYCPPSAKKRKVEIDVYYFFHSSPRGVFKMEPRNCEIGDANTMKLFWKSCL